MKDWMLPSEHAHVHWINVAGLLCHLHREEAWLVSLEHILPSDVSSGYGSGLKAAAMCMSRC